MKNVGIESPKKFSEDIQSVFEPTGRANARPMTGSVGTGSRSNQVYADCVDLSAVENASK
jgi:hypothetical protein